MLRQCKNLVSRERMRRRKRKALAGGEAPAGWYNQAYSEVGAYQVHWSESNYLPVWEAICDRLSANAKILEIGCGSGQLAHMLRDKGITTSYVGFDFSRTAVEMARRTQPEQRFEVADAYTTDLFTDVDYDTVLCTEVLEHIHDDRGVLRRVPKGRQVLATVPDFDWDSHVRFFKNSQEVRARYAELFNDQLEITEHHHSGDSMGHNGTLFLLNGRRT